MTTLINLTPHAINLVGTHANGEAWQRTVEPSGVVARCAMERTRTGDVSLPGPGGVACVDIYVNVLGDVSGVPAPEEETYFIVSRVVAEALPARADLLFPDDTVRDGEGRIVGCRALARVATPAKDA